MGFHLHVVTKKRGGAPEDGTIINSLESSEGKEGASKAEGELVDFDASLIIDTLRSHISEDGKEDVKLLTNVGTECSVTLPSETAAFPALFSELEERRDELGIEQLALSMTTLEEVFLELGKLEEEQQKKEKLEREMEEYETDSDDEAGQRRRKTLRRMKRPRMEAKKRRMMKRRKETEA